MSSLEKLIFVSDMLEEGREFWGVRRLRKLLKKDAELCFKMCLKKQYKTLNAQNKEIYNLTKKAYNYYFKETGDING